VSFEWKQMAIASDEKNAPGYAPKYIFNKKVFKSINNLAPEC